MASRFDIVDEEYNEELKDKSENEKNSKEWWKNVFKKWANERNLRSKLRRVREGCPRPTIVAVLSIQKLSNFALYIINK